MTTADDIEAWIEHMPGAADLPFRVDRSALYSVADLYKGLRIDKPESFANAWDTKVYTWTRTADGTASRPLSKGEIVATRLHDATMDGLVVDYLDAAHSVAIGFMGGHSILRTAVAYARVAKVARELRRRGFKIVTGGGPGLMEAANFGAFMAPYSDDQMQSALQVLRTAPDYGSSSDPKAALGQKQAWVNTAAQVREMLLGAWDKAEDPLSSNLGIPTWYYGSEPPNLFATVSGKYFMNSLREDGLVSLANGGLLFGKGDAGTVQEVFQNASYNYYRGSATAATPMVFLDIDFWNPGPVTDAAAGAPLDPRRKPVFPLVQKLSTDAHYPFDSQVMLSNDPDEITEFLTSKNASRVPRTADLKMELIGSR